MLTTLPSPTYYRRETYAAMDSFGRLYVHGNIVSAAGAGDLNHSYPERYDPTAQVWTVLAQPPKKIYQGSFILDTADNYIGTGAEVLNLVVGGDGVPPDTFLYSPGSNSWTSLANFPIFRTAGIGSVYFKYNEQLWLAPAGLTTPAYHYSGGTGGAWTTHANTSPSNTPILLPSNPYGQGYPIATNGNVYLDTVKYNPATDAWGSVPSGCGRVWDGSRYLYGVNPFTSHLTQFDTTTETLVSLGTPVTVPAFGGPGAMAATSTYVVLFGYQVDPVTWSNNVWVYSLATAVWTQTGEVIGTTASGLTRIPTVVQDPLSGGFYLIQGPSSPSSEGSNVLELWAPVPSPVLGVGVMSYMTSTRRGRAFAYLIGACI